MNEGLYFYDTDGRCMHGVFISLDATRVYIPHHDIRNIECIEGSITSLRYLKKVSSYKRQSYFYFSSCTE